jgi:hypothetical protein
MLCRNRHSHPKPCELRGPSLIHRFFGIAIAPVLFSPKGFELVVWPSGEIPCPMSQQQGQKPDATPAGVFSDTARWSARG